LVALEQLGWKNSFETNHNPWSLYQFVADKLQTEQILISSTLNARSRTLVTQETVDMLEMSFNSGLNLFSSMIEGYFNSKS
jgi:hypothetical protein